jgi:putative membrane protein
MEEAQARSLIEKKSAINLLEAFAVAIKHYLRGEDGIYYRYETLYFASSSCIYPPILNTYFGSSSDLYHLVKFLPAYALPAGRPSMSDPHDDAPKAPESSTHGQSFASSIPLSSSKQPSIIISQPPPGSNLHNRNKFDASDEKSLPHPVSIGSPGQRSLGISALASAMPKNGSLIPEKERVIFQREDGVYLMPARNPPPYGMFDIFPFSLLVRYLTENGKVVKGQKAARLRVKLKNEAISHKLPLEISLYLVSLRNAHA